jgi:ABC-type sugar transport system permease subunit
MTEHTSVNPAMGAYVPGVKRSALVKLLGTDWALAYMLIAPVGALILGLIAYPMITAILLSFQHKPIGVDGEFVGLQNFINLIRDPVFQRAALNTAVYTAIGVGAKFVLGLMAALVVHDAVRFNNFFRALLVLPWSAPVVVGAYAWKWILDEGRGVLNYGLYSLQVVDFPPLWLVDPRLALGSVIAVMVWQGTPFYMLNFLAGLSAIDKSLYEAAAIDGAGPVRRFIHVSLPGLKDIIIITTLLSTIWTSTTLTFVFILTNGGPVNSTQILPMLSYTAAIQQGQLGTGAAIALSAFPLLAPAIFILTRRLLREE